MSKQICWVAKCGLPAVIFRGDDEFATCDKEEHRRKAQTAAKRHHVKEERKKDK